MSARLATLLKITPPAPQRRVPFVVAEIAFTLGPLTDSPAVRLAFSRLDLYIPFPNSSGRPVQQA